MGPLAYINLQVPASVHCYVSLAPSRNCTSDTKVGTADVGIGLCGNELGTGVGWFVSGSVWVLGSRSLFSVEYFDENLGGCGVMLGRVV